jgi:hypothetical protein
MRHLLFRSLAALACFGVFILPQTSAAPKPDQSDKPDFNGTWTLDLKASDSLEPIMKKVGAHFLEQKFASRTNLKATIRQTEPVITVATRGRGFALDETLYPDGRSLQATYNSWERTASPPQPLGPRTRSSSL